MAVVRLRPPPGGRGVERGSLPWEGAGQGVLPALGEGCPRWRGGARGAPQAVSVRGLMSAHGTRVGSSVCCSRDRGRRGPEVAGAACTGRTEFVAVSACLPGSLGHSTSRVLRPPPPGHKREYPIFGNRGERSTRLPPTGVGEVLGGVLVRAGGGVRCSQELAGRRRWEGRPGRAGRSSLRSLREASGLSFASARASMCLTRSRLIPSSRAILSTVRSSPPSRP